MAEEIVLVLHDAMGADAVRTVAAERGWACVADIPRAHVVMASTVWSTPTGIDVTYYEDHTADVRYVSVEGPDASAFATQIRQPLRVVSPGDLLAIARAATLAPDTGPAIRGLSRLAVVAPPECDPRFIEVWTTAFQHPDRAVRRAGIRTGYSLRWPEMAELVRERIERDHHLRPMFEDLLAFFRPRSGIS